MSAASPRTTRQRCARPIRRFVHPASPASLPAASLPAASHGPRRSDHPGAAADRLPRQADSGLITLEWLLIVGLIAGLAASTVLIVQRVIDDASEVPVDPLVRLLEADVAAAFVAAEANGAVLVSSPMYVDANFETSCVTSLKSDFSDVVDSAVWDTPTTIPATPPAVATLHAPAKCTVTPRPNLGGS